MFYHWAAMSRDTSDPPVAQGVLKADSPGPAQAAAAKFVRAGSAILGIVAEAWPEGQQWYGMRSVTGDVRWLPGR